MRQDKVAIWAFFLAAFLGAVAAFLPLLKGGRMNVTFLAVAVVFFILGLAIARKSGEKEPGTSN
ncbi:MAG TPA: hypothetical protein VFL80_06150 [Thermoanaerobaculia bacterium]|nr:hypothetical protein [Thermoanaerobaculia bacterium]